MQTHTIGIDVGKTTFHLVALSECSGVDIKKKFSRRQLLAFTTNLPSSLILMKACVGSHFLGRALRDHGHEVRLIPAQFVKPSVKPNNNDYADAEAIAEAAARENMRFVPIETDDQRELQALHRMRDRFGFVTHSVINQLQAFLLERGIGFQTWRTNLRRHLPELLEDTNEKLTARHTPLLALALARMAASRDTNRESKRRDRADCKPRRGLRSATSDSLRRFVGSNGRGSFDRPSTRDATLLPKQHTSGDKPKLLGISKPGNRYLRRTFIHGTRAVVFSRKRDHSSLGQWMAGLEARAAMNVLVVAIANELARIIWAVFVQWRELSLSHCSCPLPTRRNGVPENLQCKPGLQDRRRNNDSHA